MQLLLELGELFWEKLHISVTKFPFEKILIFSDFFSEYLIDDKLNPLK